MSDKESLTKQETLDNIKSESSGLSTLSINKIDSGNSSESMSDSTSDCKIKIEKTKNKSEIIKDKIKKEKLNLSVKVKEEPKEKLKMEKIKDESDDIKDKKRRLKDKNGNPFLKIIGEMIDDKSDEDKQIENDGSNLSKHSSRRKQNLKNLSSGEKNVKTKLSNDGKKSNSDTNSSSEIKKEPRPLPLPAPKPKLPESKTILEKKNYSIHIEKKEYIGEKKTTVKTFKSKFRSTGLEQLPPPPKSKALSKKSVKNIAPLSVSKAEKRSLSPPSDIPNEKKLKSSPSDSKKPPPPRKILNIFKLLLLLYYCSASSKCKSKILQNSKSNKYKTYIN